MTTATTRQRIFAHVPRAAALCLLAVGAALFQAREAQAQWATSGANINNTNTGYVGVCTAAPEQAFHVNGPSEILSTGAGSGFKFRDRGSVSNSDDWVWYSNGNVARFWRSGTGDMLSVTPSGFFGFGTAAPGVRLAVNGPGANVYSTDAWIENNMHTQGNEPLAQGGGRGRMRVGTAWGYVGLYAEPSSQSTSNDLVFGASSGTVRIGPGGSSAQSLIVPNGFLGVGSGTPRVRLAVNGDGTNVYSTDAWIENNMHAQGNEALSQGGGRGRMRVGTAWGYVGLYAETSSQSTSNDLVFGASSGVVRIGPGSSAAQSLIVPNGRVGVGTATPKEALDVVGNVTVSGNISAKYQDLAEWVPTTQRLQAGTVVVLDPQRSNHVLASTSAYDTRVAGVISAQPGIALGEAGEGKVLVATTGRVKVKVDATRAPIQIGDLIVTGEAQGVAMKSEPIALGGRQIHAPGTIIGKALEPLEKGVGEILVLLSLQ